LQSDFKLSKEEIGEVYAKCSGILIKMRKYLKNPKDVVIWNYLEDLALGEPDDSVLF